MLDSSHYYAWPDSSHWSEVCSACRPDDPQHLRAIEALCATFVGPVYSWFRREVGSADAAKDLTQDFFVHLLGDARPLAHYDRERGRFRPFLRAVLENFLRNQRRDATAIKRGGRLVIFSVDWDAMERLEPSSRDVAPDVAFDRDYARAMLDRSLAGVREEFGRSRYGARVAPVLSRLVDGSAGTYEEMAVELGMTPGALRTAASRLLARLRERVHEEVARTLPPHADVNEELHHLYNSFFPLASA
jgi:RNA polymerase sigma-70 factor (ECF subfamily)